MHRSIRETRFAAIDFESAGAQAGATDTPIQIGMAVMENGELTHDSCFRSYLHTDASVVWSAQKIHGIGNEDLVGAPTLLSLWPEVRNRLSGAVVVAHSAGTEKRFLRTFPLHGFGPWVDTLPVTRALHPGLKSYNLSALCAHFGLEEKICAACPNMRWHDALFDAVGSLLLLRHLMESAELWKESAEILSAPRLDAYYRNRKKLTQK